MQTMHGKIVKIIPNWFNEISCCMQINHSVKSHSVIQVFACVNLQIIEVRFKNKHPKKHLN